MRGEAKRITRSAPQCRPLAVIAKHNQLPPGERRYTYLITDRRLLYIRVKSGGTGQKLTKFISDVA